MPRGSGSTAGTGWIGRNDPCPCGSGRKFKLCCGRDRLGNAGPPIGHVISLSSADEPVHGTAPNFGLGPLTEVSNLRQLAENFRRVSPNLPDAARNPPAVPRRYQMMAERQRQLGERLIKAGRLAAAISALSEAVRLDPGNAAAHRLLGSALLDDGRVEEAIDSLRMATVLSEDAASYHCLAIALHRHHDDEAAKAAYRRATELQPNLEAAHAGLAELYEAAGEDEVAAVALRRAAGLLPDTVAGRIYSARALILEGDFPAAEAALREALGLDPRNDDTTKLLGDALARQGRFTEAVACYDQTLALNPRRVDVHFTAAEVKRCTAADRPRLARALAALRDTALEYDRLLLHFAAGKMFDDLGEYEAAMQQFDAANEIRSQQISFDPAAFANDVDRLMQRFMAEFFAANAAFGDENETPLLIVGLPRSGTTLVEQILSRHRDIAGAGEQAFWIRRCASRGQSEATYLTPQTGRELARQYLEVLRQVAPTAARVTDKLPFNLLCLGLVHLVLPKARIIQCRRHPVDTCLSMYFTHFQQSIPFISDKSTLVAAYRIYSRLMDHWRAVLPADRFCEVAYEDLIANRETVTRRLIAFCGLDWDDACLHPEKNPRPIKTASFWQARQSVYSSSVARWRNYRPWLGELEQLLRPDDCD